MARGPLVNKIVVNQKFRIGPVTGPWIAVLILGLQSWANIAVLGPVTGLIQNVLLITL